MEETERNIFYFAIQNILVVDRIFNRKVIRLKKVFIVESKYETEMIYNKKRINSV